MKFNERYDAIIKEVSDKAKTIPEDQRKKVLNLRVSGDNYTAQTAKDISAFYVETAGGIFASKDFVPSGKDRVLALSKLLHGHQM